MQNLPKTGSRKTDGIQYGQRLRRAFMPQVGMVMVFCVNSAAVDMGMGLCIMSAVVDMGMASSLRVPPCPA